MGEVVILRHGQAQTGAKDEASYDRLSVLGHQQAAWAGEYFRGHHGEHGGFDHVISGNMVRQKETLAGLKLSGVRVEQDARLNEMDYFGVAEDMQRQTGRAMPTNVDEFQSHVPEVMRFWRGPDLVPHVEGHKAFSDRILGVLSDVAQTEGRVLLVSSTGVIAGLVSLALGLDVRAQTDVFLRVMHTSMHRFEVVNGSVVLKQFCAVPHLDPSERDHARTFV